MNLPYAIAEAWDQLFPPSGSAVTVDGLIHVSKYGEAVRVDPEYRECEW
jgi:hypothetical protein